MKRILYLTDQSGVTQGYEPAFTKLLAASGIYRNQIVVADIYKLVPKPLKKYGNELTWKFDRDKTEEIQRAFESRVRAVRPDIIVVSCPAIIGMLVDWNLGAATLQKQRGSVYEWEGLPVIVTLPITALHRTVDSRLIANDDTGEVDTYEPYTVKDGARILAWDWQKIGRIANGKARKIPPFRYSICRTREDLEAALAYARDSVLLSRDVETALHPPIVTCDGFTGFLANGACHSFVIPFYDPSKPGNCFWSADDHLRAIEVCREINALEIPKTMQNGSYDCTYYVRDQMPPTQWTLDSQYMWWAMYMELPKRLDFITSVLHDTYRYWKDDSKGDEQESVAQNMEGYWRYNALDTYWTGWNTLYLIQLMQSEKNAPFRRNFIDVMHRAYSGLALSMRGVKVDWKRRDYHRENLEKAWSEAEAELRFMLDEPDFNVSSSAHKKWLLYDLFGLRERTARGKFVQGGKDRKGANAPSAGKLPMKMAKSEHPLFRLIIEKMEEALEPRVQLSNIFGYSDDTRPFGVRGGLFMPTGRFRSAFGPAGTETTRFNSKKSNLWDGGNAQNIRGKYKDWLIPDENHIFIDVDFSQSDDVFIGYESQDTGKIEVIQSGKDGHAVHGELFFGVPYDTIVGQRGTDYIDHPITGVRQNSKRIVHGTNFQMAGYTLYVTMGRESAVAAAIAAGHTNAESWAEEKLVALCDVWMGIYRKRYPRLTRNGWYKEIADALKRDGALTNCFGITRQFLGAPTDNGTQREATAFIGQSATAGNMNRVMEEIDLGVIQSTFRDGPNPHAREKPCKMNWDSHGFHFALQVHDNFLCGLNLNHPNWREAAANLLTVMDRPVIIHGREVRIRTESSIGIRWGKGMLDWDGKNPRDIEGLVAKLKQAA